ncbi:Gfo/Idh/MocA family protein [Microlunatus speluncae]|uniref:Gfo/Idh/MocA family protein n=1 Tax=Microlunatus speluncae TaxID=2594267 RepID=UPI0012663029|nr:Gfo/Idh/MocA family oxidoreductase [Microlunatus speluncae]
MDRPVRIAFVGCGSVMSGPYTNLARRLRERGEVELVAACDVKPDRAAFVRSELGIERFTTDYTEVINADDVDAVLVLTSMPEHGPITRAALEAGKHVLVEKPMAVTLPEAQDLLALAARSPGHLVCAPHVVLSPTYQAIWRHIQRGDIGPIHLARARYGWSGPWWGQWFYQSGGGPLFDLGVYNLTTLTGLIGPARRVTAMAGTAIPERKVDGELMRVEVEDNFQITVDFGDARFGTVTTGFSMQAYRGPAVELYGGTGTIQMMGDDWAPEGYELWRNDHGAWEIHRDQDPHWPWTDGLRHLVDCIRHDREPLIRPEHAYHVLEIMIKAIESAREGRTLTIDSTFTPPTFDTGTEAADAHLVHDPSH